MEKSLLKPQKRWLWSLIAIATLASSSTIVYSLFYFRSQLRQSPPESIPAASQPVIQPISARGRIKPQGEVIHLSAPMILGETARVDRLLVKEGDRVHAGQIVAILDNYPRLEAALKQTKKQVSVAQANLAKIKAGAQTGEIQAQKAKIAGLQAQLQGEKRTQQAQIARLQAQLRGEKRTQQAQIARLQAQLNNAKVEFDRYQLLYQQGAVEASKFDSKRLEAETNQELLNAAKASLSQTEQTLDQQINEAQSNRLQTVETLQQQIYEAEATLNQIVEIRPTNLQAAQAEVESASAAVEKAQADLDLAYVRAPKEGQILKIHAWQGEAVDKEGIADLGQTDQMYVVAEVYETDIGKVRLGQQATITSSALSEKLQGKVTQIGLQIGQQAILSTDPVADVDRRVVEVKIRLNHQDSQRVIGLTNLEVEVIINR